MIKRTVEHPIQEDLYRPDLQLLEKYQSFAEELLRLALLLLAGYGFLLKEVALHEREGATFFRRMAESKWLLVVGLIAIGVSAAGSLAHRYFSTDGVEHEIRYLRLTAQAQEVELTKMQEERRREAYGRMISWFRTASWSIRMSVIALAVASISVIALFMTTVFG
jgi:hypothetical protein